MKRKRVACFFTAGYTELNAMKSFIKKINPDVDYIQLCPTGVRKSAKAIRNRKLTSINDDINGLTGTRLVNYVLDFIKKGRFHEEQYDAVLIEDDKDSRFLKIMADGSSGIDIASWNTFKKDLKEKINAEFDIQIPVIILFAAPEVEAWFISDWENGFGNLYRDKFGAGDNNFFSTLFRKFVNDQILTELYLTKIEAYGYFACKYVKLSEKIQQALCNQSFLQDKDKQELIVYSKRLEGASMLFRIEPDNVLRCCNHFFRDGYLALKNL